MKLHIFSYVTHTLYFPTFLSIHPAARPLLYTILALTNCTLRPYATAICCIRTWHYYLHDANTRFAVICNSETLNFADVCRIPMLGAYCAENEVKL